MSSKYPFINPCKGYMNGYNKLIDHFINPYKRVYVSSTNGKKEFIIRCTFVNPLRIYYSTLIFYSVPYPVLAAPGRRLTLPQPLLAAPLSYRAPYTRHSWSYSYFTLSQPLLAAPLSYRTPSTRRTWAYSYFTLSQPLLAAPLRTLILSYPIYSPHPYLTLPQPLLAAPLCTLILSYPSTRRTSPHPYLTLKKTKEFCRTVLDSRTFFLVLQVSARTFLDSAL